LPGILGVVTILLNNIAIPRIGVTLAAGAGLFGQLIMSGLVQHFGLFGMPVNRLVKEKIVVFVLLFLGIIVMITM
jgi:transporter family-2 protein